MNRVLNITLVFAVVVCHQVSSRTATAQEQPAPQSTQIYYLKHADASEVSKVLTEVLGQQKAKLAVDPRINGIIVQADKKTLDMIEQVLKQVDAPAPPLAGDDALQIKMFSLDSPPTPALQSILETITSGTDTMFAIDETRKLVVAKGRTASLKALEATLLQLEVPQQQAKNDLLVRIVWLVGGLKNDKTKPVPADLKEVQDELAKIGVSDLAMAAQSVVSVDASNQTVFQTEGRATLDVPTDFQVEGAIVGKKGESTKLEVSIELSQIKTVQEGANGRGRLSRESISSLRTTITAPLGHAVVLGVTPIESLTSVFVVQMLPRK